jgi:hypothetical protein
MYDERFPYRKLDVPRFDRYEVLIEVWPHFYDNKVYVPLKYLSTDPKDAKTDFLNACNLADKERYDKLYEKDSDFDQPYVTVSLVGFKHSEGVTRVTQIETYHVPEK